MVFIPLSISALFWTVVRKITRIYTKAFFTVYIIFKTSALWFYVTNNHKKIKQKTKKTLIVTYFNFYSVWHQESIWLKVKLFYVINYRVYPFIMYIYYFFMEVAKKRKDNNIVLRRLNFAIHHLNSFILSIFIYLSSFYISFKNHVLIKNTIICVWKPTLVIIIKS